MHPDLPVDYLCTQHSGRRIKELKGLGLTSHGIWLPRLTTSSNFTNTPLYVRVVSALAHSNGSTMLYVMEAVHNFSILDYFTPL